MSDIAFKVLIGNGYDDILFKTIMLKGEKGDQGEAGATGIDDSVVALDKTWSSSKIKNEMDSLPKNFSALNDVEINTPQDDQAPLYDATAGKWKNKTVDASTLKYNSVKTIKQQIDDKSVLTGLNDVAISSPQGNQGLVYNATTGKWENGAVSSTSALAQLTDVLLNTPIENLSSLVYDLTSGKWKDKRLKIICTQAQYDAWKNASPSQLIPNTDYLITDAPNLNPTANDVEYSNGVSVKQAIDNKVNTNDICYKAGDVDTVSFAILSGYVSNNITNLEFSFIPDKIIPNGVSINITSLTLTVRSTSGNYVLSNELVTNNPSYTVTFSKRGKYINITVAKSSQYSGITNNTPVAIVATIGYSFT